MQFLPRKGKLNLAVTMRSNDVYVGFPGDIFAFTFIQEIVARSIGLDIGKYSHFVGSLHLYDKDEPRARKYLDEGFQTPVSMPHMPKGDPSASLAWLLKTEESIRMGNPEYDEPNIESYWLDLARLLRIKMLYDHQKMRQLIKTKDEMASPAYNTFIRGRQVALERKLEIQPSLPGIPASI